VCAAYPIGNTSPGPRPNSHRNHSCIRLDVQHHHLFLPAPTWLFVTQQVRQITISRFARAALAQHDLKDQGAIAILAYKAACYCTGTGTQNAASYLGKATGVFRGKSGGGREMQRTASFLNTLNQLQQQKLFQLLTSEARSLQTQASLRSQMIVLLDGLKAGKDFVERKARQAGGTIAQSEMRNIVFEANVFTQLQTSLTDPQRRFILQNIASAGK
jgi:hypothetical protein